MAEKGRGREKEREIEGASRVWLNYELIFFLRAVSAIMTRMSVGERPSRVFYHPNGGWEDRRAVVNYESRPSKANAIRSALNDAD